MPTAEICKNKHALSMERNIFIGRYIWTFSQSLTKFLLYTADQLTLNEKAIPWNVHCFVTSSLFGARSFTIHFFNVAGISVELWKYQYNKDKFIVMVSTENPQNEVFSRRNWALPVIWTDVATRPASTYECHRSSEATIWKSGLRCGRVHIA